jgi:hypothetical protein
MATADRAIINEYRQKGILDQYKQNNAQGSANSSINPDINIYNNLRLVLDKYRGRMVGPIMAARITVESAGQMFCKVIERRNGTACGLLQMYNTYKTFYGYFSSGTRNRYARMPSYPEKALYFPPLNLWMAGVIYNIYAKKIAEENTNLWTTPSADLTIAVNMATAAGIGFFRNGLMPLMRALNGYTINLPGSPYNDKPINLIPNSFVYNVLLVSRAYFKSEAAFNVLKSLPGEKGAKARALLATAGDQAIGRGIEVIYTRMYNHPAHMLGTLATVLSGRGTGSSGAAVPQGFTIPFSGGGNSITDGASTRILELARNPALMGYTEPNNANVGEGGTCWGYPADDLSVNRSSIPFDTIDGTPPC